jgi:hypothetical protein
MFNFLLSVMLVVAVLAVTGFIATWLVPIVAIIIITIIEYRRYCEQKRKN